MLRLSSLRYPLLLQEEEEGKDQDEFKLRIAWQYRRYIKTGQAGAAPAGGSGLGMGGSSGGSSGAAGGRAATNASCPGRSSASGSAPRRPVGLRDWCHQFDLLKSAGEEGLQQCRAQLVDCSGTASSSGGGDASTGGGGDSSTGRLLGAAADFVQSLQEQPAAGATQPAAGAAAVAARAQGAAALPPRGPQPVGRIAVLSLGSLSWQLGSGAALATSGSVQPYSSLGGSSGSNGGGSSSRSPGTAVLRALLQLKALVRDRRCTAAVSVPAGLFSPSDVARMQHLADCVVALESVADDSDIVRCGGSGRQADLWRGGCAAGLGGGAAVSTHLLRPRLHAGRLCTACRHCSACSSPPSCRTLGSPPCCRRLAPDSASVAGLLHLRKLPALGTMAPPAPEVALHLIRHRRRRLAISPVEIDPEAELAEAEAASGAGRSVASVLCGGPPAADRAVDF